MFTANYEYSPGTPVYVLLPGDCASTFYVKAAMVNRVEIRIVLTAPTTTVDYVVTITDGYTGEIRVVNELDMFPDKDTANAASVLRFTASFI
jgi:hypothetical protein